MSNQTDSDLRIFVAQGRQNPDFILCGPGRDSLVGVLKAITEIRLTRRIPERFDIREYTFKPNENSVCLLFSDIIADIYALKEAVKEAIEEAERERKHRT